MKRVRILVYEGTRNEIERAIQYRNIKGRVSPRNGIVMDEHFVPDTHVVVEIDRAEIPAIRAALGHLKQAGLDLEPCYKTLEKIVNGAYGGDVRV